MAYFLVLSDELLKELYAYKHSQSFSNQIMDKLLHYYRPPHITNVKQLQRIGQEDSSLLTQLAQSNFVHQTLEELSEKTVSKIILTKESTAFPYVNIDNDVIENNFTSTYAKNTPRSKAKEHIKALLENANSVFIYDGYINNNWSNAKKLFTELMPKKTIRFFYADYHFDQSMKSEISGMHTGWSIREDRTNPAFTHLHDRYLVIDNKIEIILTSGFDYLFDDSKDFSYIVRIRS